jgi:hypothetical protein
MQNLGKIVLLLGLLLMIIGIIIYFWGDKFSWLGHLPGDIWIKKDNFTLFLPITTMLILSFLLSLIFKIVQKLMH